MRPSLTIVSIIGAIPLLVEGIAQAIRSTLEDVEVVVVHSSIAEVAPGSTGEVAVFVVESETNDELGAAIGAHASAGTRVLVVGHLPNPHTVRWIASKGAFGQISSRESLSVMVAAVSSVRSGERLWSDLASADGDLVRPELPRISERELAVITHYVGGSGKTLEQTAAALGISVQTVRAHLVRVRARLRDAGFEASDVLALRQLLVE